VRRAAPDDIATPRMLGERLRLEHDPELATLLLDPRVGRVLWPAGPGPTLREVRDNLRDKIEHWKRQRFGMWLFRDRETGAMVGRGGLQLSPIDGNWEVEVGWAIVPERWGQGLATELAHASVDVAFNHLELDNIVAIALPGNAASRRVMEKSGLTYERDIEHGGLAHVLYRRHRC
jgi:ribosomal-protein-alanine N-acetyltransferase